jgi:hypothetical protein
MSLFRRIYSVLYSAITVVFGLCALCLIIFAALELCKGVNPWADVTLRERFNLVIESVGILTIAVAALELSQTILEEEVLRAAHMSAPTRVRRFISRFMVVVIVSLSIEFLVVVFKLAHEDPAKLPQASAIGVGVALMFAAWGVFIRLNRSAEELEPEAMAEAKREDQNLE